jgi:hypothetical protein
VKHRRRRGTAVFAIVAFGALAGLTLLGCAVAKPGSSKPRPPKPQIVTVFPIPGDRVASPQTQIAFRGVPISRLKKVVVTGSKSGRHLGQLAADSDRRGGSFLPAKPFVPGEVVTVRTGLSVLGAT